MKDDDDEGKSCFSGKHFRRVGRWIRAAEIQHFYRLRHHNPS